MTAAIDVSVVAPVFRTAAFVDELHDRLVAATATCGRSELIYVDDASPDDSAVRLVRLARSDERVVVITMPTNAGQGRAVLAGLAASRGEVVVVLDADLQDPPEALPGLVARLRTGDADAVFATRRNRYASFGRSITGRVFKTLLRHLVDVPVGSGSYVAIRRRTVDRLLALEATHPYLVGMIGRTAERIDAVEVPRSPRRDGHSSWTGAMRTRVAVRALYDVAVTWKV